MSKENYQETNRISKVVERKDYYELTFGMSCILYKKYGVIPKENDMLTVHQKGGSFGTIRGMDLNGKKIFWKTDEELETERVEWLRNNEEKKQEKFKDGVAELDRQYNSLPKCFQERIDKFRIDYESYELFCCEQAVAIADACKTPDAVEEFGKKEWVEQLLQVPALSDGHSGNTFGASCILAYWYLSNPENVQKVNGALSPLVGSVEYGEFAR